MRHKSILFVGVVALTLCVHLSSAQEKAPRSAPALPPGTTAHRDLEYVPNGHERNKLDLYLPEKANGPLPVVVWVHGGSWKAGSKGACPAIPMVLKGYAVASINYRLSQHAIFPAQLDDCKAAIRWLRANAKKYNLDVNNIGVWGASAGGHLVALLGTTMDKKELEGKLGNLDQSSRVQAVCDWFGPTDFTKMIGRSPTSPVSQLLGGPVADNKDKAEAASPLKHVSKDAAPFLIMHGDKDTTVPLRQSEVLNDALKKAGVEVTFKVLPGAAHGGPAFRTDEVRKQIEEFFDKHLKKKSGT